MAVWSSSTEAPSVISFSSGAPSIFPTSKPRVAGYACLLPIRDVPGQTVNPVVVFASLFSNALFHELKLVLYRCEKGD